MGFRKLGFLLLRAAATSSLPPKNVGVQSSEAGNTLSVSNPGQF